MILHVFHFLLLSLFLLRRRRLWWESRDGCRFTFLLLFIAHVSRMTNCMCVFPLVCAHECASVVVDVPSFFFVQVTRCSLLWFSFDCLSILPSTHLAFSNTLYCLFHFLLQRCDSVCVCVLSILHRCCCSLFAAKREKSFAVVSCRWGKDLWCCCVCLRVRESVCVCEREGRQIDDLSLRVYGFFSLLKRSSSFGVLCVCEYSLFLVERRRGRRSDSSTNTANFYFCITYRLVTDSSTTTTNRFSPRHSLFRMPPACFIA